MLIKAALNGNRSPHEHPALPITPGQLALSAGKAIVAGAGAIHLHVRDQAGRESLTPDDVARTLRVVRAASIGAPIGVSTAAWIEPDIGRRLALIARWNVRPDFASVNLHEDGALDIALALLDCGVAVEAGLSSAAAAELLAASGLAGRCLRVLIEPAEQELAAARAEVMAIEQVLDRAGVRVARLLHGENANAWPLLGDALARGYDTRIGLEDVLTLPDGTTAPDNAALVAAALGMLRARVV